jgi:hypothetical protein
VGFTMRLQDAVQGVAASSQPYQLCCVCFWACWLLLLLLLLLLTAASDC